MTIIRSSGPRPFAPQSLQIGGVAEPRRRRLSGGMMAQSAPPPPAAGLVKLANGTITSPVAYIDLALPDGYTSFILELAGFGMVSAFNLIGVFSQDGGSTFLFDTVNWDTYHHVGYEFYSSLDALLSPNGGQNSMVDAVLDIAGLWGGSSVPPADDVGLSATIKIFPGDASHVPSGRMECTHRDNLRTPNDLCHSTYSFALNPAATNPPSNGRVTNIVLMPYGTPDFPPTSGETITAGSYILWGTVP